MNKPFYKYIFVILVYRNYNDLRECLESIKTTVGESKSIIVDAFYSEECSKEIEKIAKAYECDYFSVENKGYSFGNNFGIEFAKKEYDFNYVIVSNPDIVVKKLNIDDKYVNIPCAIGPKIRNLSGKKQNPMYYGHGVFCQKLIYKGLKHNKKIWFALGIGLNKLSRMVNNILYAYKRKVRVYQLHGSFFIFTKPLVERYDKLFDENMFLFAEESYLAFILNRDDIPSLFLKDLEVMHKEDGSMKFRNDINNQLKKANIYVMEKYYGFGK